MHGRKNFEKSEIGEKGETGKIKYLFFPTSRLARPPVSL